MIESDDIELVREYASSGSEQAFATLVSRHLNLVYSVALRHVGNPHQAEEISQAVFLILARKAGSLRHGTVVSGWLYAAARLTAANYMRGEIRRTHREQEAHMQSLQNEPDSDAWAQVAPLLDQAMADLNKTERDAIVLRFFNAKSFQEVGASLGTTEDAAKMRVNRGVEKLRKFFARRGVALPAAVICGAVSTWSVQAAPAGLAASVTTAVVHGSATAASVLTITKTTLKIMAWTKVKTGAVVAVGLLLAAGTATVTLEQINQRKTYPWQVRNVNTGVLNQVPPQVRIVPSKFQEGGGWGASDDKVLGICQAAGTILQVAYGSVSSYRMILPTNLPDGKFDFISNLPKNSKEALQRAVQKKFGLTVKRETRQMDVLRLSVKNAKAEGLRPSEAEGGSARSSEGHFSCMNQPLSCLTAMLENSFKLPVVDHTGLGGRFDIDLVWDQPDLEHPAPDALKQALLEELGLELLPAKEAIDMLVVQERR